MDVVFQDECKYRLVWISPDMSEAEYGSYLFDEPWEAADTKVSIKSLFPDRVVWLEDHEHNIIEIPNRKAG